MQKITDIKLISIDLKKRSPEAQKAYFQGYEAGYKKGIEEAQKILANVELAFYTKHIEELNAI